jgi:(p)ppGpp synthase/HD superfamily hydrolase
MQRYSVALRDGDGDEREREREGQTIDIMASGNIGDFFRGWKSITRGGGERNKIKKRREKKKKTDKSNFGFKKEGKKVPRLAAPCLIHKNVNNSARARQSGPQSINAKMARQRVKGCGKSLGKSYLAGRPSA